MTEAKRTSYKEAALLISDRDETRELTNALRLFDVTGSYFESMSHLWDAFTSSPPLMAIIDVRKISDGDRSILDHPLIVSKKIPIIFYYDESSLPLLRSTSEIFHLGYLKRQVDYAPDLKTLLKRFNHFYFLDKQVLDLTEKSEALFLQKNALFQEIENRKQMDTYISLLNRIRISVSEKKHEFSSYEHVIAMALRHLPDLSSFSLLGLDSNMQRLQAIEIKDKKWVSIPSIWLGQKNSDGIDVSSFSLASQVTMDILGGDIMALAITGIKKYPDYILALKVENTEFLKKFDWDAFEALLSSFYRKHLLLKQEQLKETNVKPVSSLFSQLDSAFFQANESGDFIKSANTSVLISISFKKLIGKIQDEVENRFYWNKFHNDFILKLSYELQGRTIYQDGYKDFFVLVSQEESGEIFKTLKSFAHRFGCWRFFEDQERMIAYDLKPSIKSIPSSSPALMSFLEGQELFQKAVANQAQPLQQDNQSDGIIDKRLKELQI